MFLPDKILVKRAKIGAKWTLHQLLSVVIMAGERKPVTIHYRRLADGTTLGKATLEEKIREAMQAQIGGQHLESRYTLRIWENGEDNFFVNHFYDGQKDNCNLVFGDVIHFTKGHLQALFNAGQKDEPYASVEQMPAPAQKEYIHSLMHWMVKGNHAFVIQSTSLRTETLESYLTWLLTQKSKVVASPFQVVLASKFNEEAVGGDLSDIQELIIGGVVAHPPSEAPQKEAASEVMQHGKIETHRTTGWQQAREILATLLGGTANVENMMKGVPGDAELSVEVHIGYKTKKRKVSREGLNQLETGLRNIPDSQLIVRAKNGNKTSDGSIRLHHNASIKLRTIKDGDEVRPGSLLDPADVLRAMQEAYDIFVANGKISEDLGT